MVSGRINITFNAMLKFYHILLHKKKITHKPFDVIYLDEAGDTNMVMLEIIKLLPSPLKIIVGDKYQNIYAFNGTVNGFKELENESLILNMTKTFRCTTDIAEKIQIFCRKHLDPNMDFVGLNEPVKLQESKSMAFIARTNSSLVGKMIQLDAIGQPYNLTRKPKDIFEFMLFLLYLKVNTKSTRNPDYQHIQDAYNEYSTSDTLKRNNSSFFNYVSKEFPDDVNLSSAIATIMEHSRDEIFNTYNNAKKHENTKHKHFMTLGTSHSLKGQEYDSIELADDMRNTFNKCLENKEENGEYSNDDLQTLNLVYVALSRAKYELISCDWAFK